MIAGTYGEIDIVEAIGARPNIAYGNAHSYNSNKNKGISDNAVGTTVDNLSTAFNTYSIEWLPDSISFLVNGSSYHNIRRQSDRPADWPFSQEYYLIINLAMGGSWGGEKYNEYPPDGIDPAITRGHLPSNPFAITGCSTNRLIHEDTRSRSVVIAPQVRPPVTASGASSVRSPPRCPRRPDLANHLPARARR